jgi:hypothetical protein
MAIKENKLILAEKAALKAKLNARSKKFIAEPAVGHGRKRQILGRHLSSLL